MVFKSILPLNIEKKKKKIIKNRGLSDFDYFFKFLF